MTALVCLLAVCAAFATAGCGQPQVPPALEDLRRIISTSAFETSHRAAPDLAAEAERSLAAAEAAFARRDQAGARRMATLGRVQALTAAALVRQQSARSRIEAAERRLAEGQEDGERFRSERIDAEREVRRLEQAALDPASGGADRRAEPD